MSNEWDNMPIWMKIQMIENLCAARLQQFANNRGYDSIVSACSYATSENAVFKKEAQIAVKQRDALWAICATLTGPARIETLTWEEVEEALPVLSWDEADG